VPRILSIKDNYIRERDAVAQCAKDNSRDSKGVLLLSVSKTVGPEGVAEAIEAGACAFGENRPEQIVQKAELYPQVDWHFIGNIQSRKIRDIVNHATLIHSVYKPEHLPKIDTAAKEAGKTQRILVEVNVSGEASKSGLAPDEVQGFVDEALTFPNILVCGLMTMAPQGDAEAVEQTFAGLKELFDSVRSALPATAQDAFCEISAGMSEDWQCAIAHGSTIVRLGRAIFTDNFN
jgi:hypothetical protein